MAGQKGKRKGRVLPDVLTANEQAALLKQPNPRYPTGERNRLMLSIMLNTGLRLSEATSLEWRDIDLMTGKLKVRQGKGAKDRMLWVDCDLDLLRHWRERQAKEIPGNPAHVFTTLQGAPVSGRYVQAMLKRYAAKAGIARRVHPHLLRHSFATDFYRETKDLVTTAKALGHARVATTEIYTHLVNEDVEKAMRSFRRPAIA